MPPSGAVRLALCLLALCAGPPAAAAEDPFASESLRVPGRPVAVVGLRFSGNCAAKGTDWLVVSVSGAPPDEVRRLTLLGCPAGERAAELTVPAEVVAFDVGDAHPAPGDEVVWLGAAGLEIVSPASGATLRRLPLPLPGPLPPRTRELSRMRFLDRWQGDSRLAALVPSASGAWLVPLDGEAPRALPLPLLASYLTEDPGPPVDERLLRATLEWPGLDLADDDGDGRPDLYALSRFGVWIFRNGENGLPAAPTRRLPLRPFTREEELRHEASGIRLFARDVDGDGLGDVVIDRGAGSLLESRNRMELYRNAGGGVSLEGEPDLRIAEEGGFASVYLVDLDADGRAEVFQSGIRFGILQLVRMLVTRRAEVELRLYDPARGATPTWKEEISLALDFGAGRLADLTPSLDGDWNGDGTRDLLTGAGGERLAVRLGERREEGMAFGDEVARQKLPTTAARAVLDVDGDGLDDLVLFDPHDFDGAVHVLRNRGLLPGTPPRIRPTD